MTLKTLLVGIIGITIGLPIGLLAVKWWSFNKEWERSEAPRYNILSTDCSKRRMIDNFWDAMLVNWEIAQLKDTDFFTIQLHDSRLMLVSKNGADVDCGHLTGARSA